MFVCVNVEDATQLVMTQTMEKNMRKNCGELHCVDIKLAVQLQHSYSQGEDYKSNDFMHCNQMINIIHHRVKKKRNWNVSQKAGREETMQHVCVYACGIDRLARCWVSN